MILHQLGKLLAALRCIEEDWTEILRRYQSVGRHRWDNVDTGIQHQNNHRHICNHKSCMHPTALSMYRQFLRQGLWKAHNSTATNIPRRCCIAPHTIVSHRLYLQILPYIGRIQLTGRKCPCLSTQQHYGRCRLTLPNLPKPGRKGIFAGNNHLPCIHRSIHTLVLVMYIAHVHCRRWDTDAVYYQPTNHSKCCTRRKISIWTVYSFCCTMQPL